MRYFWFVALSWVLAGAAYAGQGFEADFGGCPTCTITGWVDGQYTGPIAFPHTMFNDNNVWNPATARYTPVAFGGASVNVVCSWQIWIETGAPDTGNPQFVAKMVRNGGGAGNPKGGEWSGIGTFGSVAGTAIMQGSAVVHMDAGDYLEWFMYANAELGGVAVNADQPHTYVSCAAF